MKSRQSQQPEGILPASYKYQQQTRSQNQIQLTNKISYILTQINLKRIRKKKQLTNPQQINDKKQSLFHFVCLCGIPPFENQYENLGLPQEKTILYYNGLKGKYTQQEYLQIFKTFGFQYEAAKVRKVIQQKSKKFKIIIVYHSFGTFCLMNYLRLYENDHRISGMIDIGGAPIRYDPNLLGLIASNYQTKLEDLLKNKNKIHQEYHNQQTIKLAGFVPFQNEYQTILFLKLPTSPSFQTIFEYMRKLPKVLKLFIYGKKDRIFPEHLINQKVVYYNYIDKLDQQYEKKANESYKRYYGADCKNIQQKFIFCIEGGGHSIHMQKKYNESLREAIRQYVEVLRGVNQ